jgi:hypothetical protein
VARPLTAKDLRLTLEGEVLGVVSSFGGERIIASPRMEQMTRDLADLCERRESEARQQEREALAAEVAAIPEATYEQTVDEGCVSRAAVLSILRGEKP